MIKFINEIGNRYGRLVVIKKAEGKSNEKMSWECLCDCGNTITVRGDSLRNGNTKSCGCLSKEKASARSRENNPTWKGDKATKESVHQRVGYYKPKFCERCKERIGTELSYNGTNGEWSQNPDDYEWLCGSCHKLKDFGSGAVMTKARVHRIREFHRLSTITKKELATLFKINRATIYAVVNHKGIYA